jgi:hypothetical protein
MSQEARKQGDPENDAAVSRRQAFVKLGVGSICAACAGAGVFGYS